MSNCPEVCIACTITLMGRIQGASRNARLFINERQRDVIKTVKFGTSEQQENNSTMFSEGF